MYKKNEVKKSKLLIGWREWCALPQLNIPIIKAKVDTGAKTSALHAENINFFQKKGKDFVRFRIYPLQRDNTVSLEALAEVIDHRNVMSSNGHHEKRYVITTNLVMGDVSWPIEVTLSNRDPLQYRMLLGREALRKHVIIDPNDCFNLGKYTNRLAKSKYFSGDPKL